MKLKPVNNVDGTLRGYAFKCPGCKGHHVFYVSGTLVWRFNGDFEKPTFEPSLCNSHPGDVDRGGNIKPFKCHLNLVAGSLQYHLDCTHENKGKVFPLPDIEENFGV